MRSENEVKQLLKRILASPFFNGNERLSSLLKFVVEAALNPQNGRPDAYIIGVKVFGRDVSFDPNTDHTVIMGAMWVSKKLEQFYDSLAGQQYAVKISIPIGTVGVVFLSCDVITTQAPKGLLQ